MKNKLLLIWLIFQALIAGAQPDYQSVLPEISVEGFYIIDLPLSVRGYARTDLSDLRIRNSAGDQMPYLVRKDIHITNKNDFIPYPIHKLRTDNRQTRILIETNGDTLSSLLLNIKNADVWKNATLLGSTDTTNWYTVSERLVLSGNFRQETTNTLQAIDFPLSDYPFYLLVINDSISAPLNITEVGHMDSEYLVQQNLTPIPTHTDICKRGDTTIIRLKYDASYPICGIRLYISSPVFYRRNLLLSCGKSGIIDKRLISSDYPGSLYIPCYQKTDSLSLFILNGDNPPLGIDSITSYADKLFLVAYLPIPGEYSLTYGDSTAHRPDYDMVFFEDKIPSDLKRLSIKSTEIIAKESPDSSSNSFMLFLRKYGIWLLIIAISLQIIYMVRKMMRE